MPNIALRCCLLPPALTPGVDGSFTVLEFCDPSNPRIVYLDRMTDSEYLDSLHDVAVYRHAHQQLRNFALSCSDSQQVITQLLQKLTS